MRIAALIIFAALLLYLQGSLHMFVGQRDLGEVGFRTAVALAYFSVAGALVWLASTRLDPWLARRLPRLPARLLAGALALLCAMAGATAILYGAVFPLLMGRPVTGTGLYAIAYKACVAALLVYGWLVFNRSNRSNQDAAQGLQADTNRLAADLGRAELAMLQAQIEPHFLFNTLALVKRQYRTDPAQAAQVMETLAAFLESAAPALQQDSWTLGQELDLVQLYLDILTYRFGATLAHRIDVPDSYRQQPLPALVLATLVENAVRHGLAPKTGAGSLSVTAQERDGGLHIEVADDGVGLRQQSGSGLGLTTVRARLRSAFGDAARLLVQPGQPSGVRATVTIAGAAANAH